MRTTTTSVAFSIPARPIGTSASLAAALKVVRAAARRILDAIDPVPNAAARQAERNVAEQRARYLANEAARRPFL
mgnify:CR=1 FL=1